MSLAPLRSAGPRCYAQGRGAEGVTPAQRTSRLQNLLKIPYSPHTAAIRQTVLCVYAHVCASKLTFLRHRSRFCVKTHVCV